MKNINGLNQLEDFIINCAENKKVCVIYFGAVWCGPCAKLKEKLHDENVYKKMDKLEVAYVDVDDDENEEIVKKYKVSVLPTQLFISLTKSEISDNLKVKVLYTIKGYDFQKFENYYGDCLEN